MRKLYDLDPKEVSLVGKAANKKKFLVYKSLKGKEMPNREIQNLVNAVDAETMKKIEKSLKSVKAVKKSDGDMAPRKDSAVFKSPEDEHDDHHQDGAGLDDRAVAAVKAAARILAPHKDKIHMGHMQAMAKEIGMEGGGPMEDGVDKGVAYPQKVEDEHHAEALDMAKKAYQSHLEKMGYRKYPDQQPMQKAKHDNMEDDGDDEGEDDVSKTNVSKSAEQLSAFNAEQKAQLEVIFKSNQELVKKNADLEEQLKAERSRREVGEYREKVKVLKHLGADSEELATTLHNLSQKDPEAAKKIEAVLKAADAQIGMGGDLYGERGTRISKSAAGSPEAKLDALVDSVVQKSDGNKTREEIYDEVLKTPEGRRLYSEFKSTRPHNA